MSKNKKNRQGVVYSTNPDFEYNHFSALQQSLAPADNQALRVERNNKGRRGKTVTLITGFKGPQDDLEALGKKLKNACGVGGSAKDGEIIIQGDNRDRVVKWLLENGYPNTKPVGG